MNTSSQEPSTVRAQQAGTVAAASTEGNGLARHVAEWYKANSWPWQIFKPLRRDREIV